jgi:hypothetical protein
MENNATAVEEAFALDVPEETRTLDTREVTTNDTGISFNYSYC